MSPLAPPGGMTLRVGLKMARPLLFLRSLGGAGHRLAGVLEDSAAGFDVAAIGIDSGGSHAFSGGFPVHLP
jgi:hypothetical protein